MTGAMIDHEAVCKALACRVAAECPLTWRQVLQVMAEMEEGFPEVLRWKGWWRMGNQELAEWVWDIWVTQGAEEGAWQPQAQAGVRVGHDQYRQTGSRESRPPSGYSSDSPTTAKSADVKHKKESCGGDWCRFRVEGS